MVDLFPQRKILSIDARILQVMVKKIIELNKLRTSWPALQFTWECQQIPMDQICSFLREAKINKKLHVDFTQSPS
ncbi:hypothetical protein AC249_AIPGENE24353 [Exaiptasia diaphana]|nr:hypothetical protein AC249_AIPGENE24353 [Exaiptasia diaphana]